MYISNPTVTAKCRPMWACEKVLECSQRPPYVTLSYVELLTLVDVKTSPKLPYDTSDCVLMCTCIPWCLALVS